MAQRVVAWTAHETPARPITAEYVGKFTYSIRTGARVKTTVADLVMGVIVPLSKALEEANVAIAVQDARIDELREALYAFRA